MGRSSEYDFKIVDITEPTRALIKYMDSRCDELSFDPVEMIQRQAQWGRRGGINGNRNKLARELRADQVFKNLGDAETAADYLLDVFYPALLRTFEFAGIRAGAVHLAKIRLSTTRQIHATALVACV